MNRRPTRLREDFLRYLCQTSLEPMGIVVDHARGTTIVDVHGKTYLDFTSGIGVASIGHAHPKVIRAIREQASRYLHVMVYGELIQEPQVRLATRLAQITPEALSVTYFTNSGTEAVEGALKTAKKFTGRRKLVAFTRGFHGDSHGSLSVTGRRIYQKPFLPLLPDVQMIPFNNKKTLKAINRQTAGVIIEPIQSEGGVQIPHDDFLHTLRKRCHETGALLIFDEVMTGLGRTGSLFACQHWDATPDILVLAKALGGGMPLGAFISRPEIMKTLSRNPPLSHVTTFGGHPICCAAGLAALEIILEKNLMDQAKMKGKRLLETLKSWKGPMDGVQDVRGKGLLIGLELESAELTHRFVTACRRYGLILGWTLHSNSVVRLAPPLVITQGEMDLALGIMRKALIQAVRGR